MRGHQQLSIMLVIPVLPLRRLRWFIILPILLIFSGIAYTDNQLFGECRWSLKIIEN